MLLEEYEGDAERVWTEATDTDDLRRRIGSLPGFGDMKIIGLGSVLALRFGVEAAAELVPSYPCLGGVDSPEALAEYQAAKRALKSALRAPQPHRRPYCAATPGRNAPGLARAAPRWCSPTERPWTSWRSRLSRTGC